MGDWTLNERKEQRAIQDVFLDLPDVINWAKVHGDDIPIAGPGTPSVQELRANLFFQVAKLLRETILDHRAFGRTAYRTRKVGQ